MRPRERRSASWLIMTDRQGCRSVLSPPHLSDVIPNLTLGFACNNVHASEGKVFRICFLIFVSGLSHYSRTIETFSARLSSCFQYVHLFTLFGYTPRQSANELLQPNLHCCSTMNSRREDGGHCLHPCIYNLVTRILYISTHPGDSKYLISQTALAPNLPATRYRSRLVTFV